MGEIVFPPALVFEPAVPQRGTTSAEFVLVGVGSVGGTGNWSGTWRSEVDPEGATPITQRPLIGTGAYLVTGQPLTARFQGQLSLQVVGEAQPPFPAPPTQRGEWRGSVTANGCRLEGFLFRTATTTETPGYYEVSGEYRFQKGDLVVTRVVISSPA